VHAGGDCLGAERGDIGVGLGVKGVEQCGATKDGAGCVTEPAAGEGGAIQAWTSGLGAMGRVLRSGYTLSRSFAALTECLSPAGSWGQQHHATDKSHRTSVGQKPIVTGSRLDSTKITSTSKNGTAINSRIAHSGMFHE
jgi:hypothetical protein